MTVREMLDKIDAFLVEEDRDTASDLWDVLCALRGPEGHASKERSQTTATSTPTLGTQQKSST